MKSEWNRKALCMYRLKGNEIPVQKKARKFKWKENYCEKISHYTWICRLHEIVSRKNTKDIPTTQTLSQADWCIDFIRQTETFSQHMTNGRWKSTHTQRGWHKVRRISINCCLRNKLIHSISYAKLLTSTIRIDGGDKFTIRRCNYPVFAQSAVNPQTQEKINDQFYPKCFVGWRKKRIKTDSGLWFASLIFIFAVEYVENNQKNFIFLPERIR